MKFFMTAFLVMVFTGNAYSSERTHGSRAVSEQVYSDDVKVAVSMALDKMEEIGLSVSDMSMVVAKHRRFVVVSFVTLGNVRGGAIHVVYDPAKRRIVRVEGEQ